jgi:dienelactone hydrolase
MNRRLAAGTAALALLAAGCATAPLRHCATAPLREAGPGPGNPVLALPAGARSEAVSLPGPEGVTLRAQLFLPASATKAPVIALHGCSGLGPASGPLRLFPRERDWAARLVAAGHPVLFPDSFGSRGLGPACGERGFPAGPFGARRDDALAAARWAQAQPWGQGKRTVLLGWSHGGSTTLAAWAAAPPELVAGAIAFYPGCIGAPRPAGTAPLLMLLGAQDDWTAPQPCERLASGVAAITRVTYPGAHHGFDGLQDRLVSRVLPNGRTVHVGGQAAARQDAQARVTAFLASLD